MGNWIQTSAAGPQTGGGTYAPLLPASVAASENTSRRYIRTGDQVTITAVEVVPTRQADDRAEWFEVWFYDAHLAAWGGSEGKWKIGDPITIWRPLWDSSWIGSGYKVRVTTGAAAGENNPASAIESSAFAISAIGNPAATVITGGAIGDISYFLRDGIWWFAFTLSWDISASDAHFWTSKLTAQNGKYVGGTWTPSDREDGAERTVQEFVNDGALTRSLYIEWPNNGPDEEYPTVKLRFHNKSRRVSDNSGDGGWVAQTSAFGSSVGFLDVTPEAQDAAFPADRLKRSSIGGGLVVDAITGELRVPTAGAPINRVINATFASGIADWIPIIQTGGPWTHDATTGKSANGAIKSAVLAAGGYYYAAQYVACVPGEVPTLSAWYKSSAGAADGAYLFVNYCDSSQAEISGGYYTSGRFSASTAWAQASYTFPAAPAGAAYVRINFGCDASATGTWWFDDVSLTVPAVGGGVETDTYGNVVAKVGPGMQIDASLQLVPKVGGPLYVDIANAVSMRTTTDFEIVNVGGVEVLSQKTINLAKAYGFNTAEFEISGGAYVMKALGLGKLIAGSALFTGEAVFAYSGGGKVTINASGIALADHNTSPTSTVAIASAGISFARGSNGLSITAGGVTISEAGGGYLSATSAGMSIVKGSNYVTVSASGVLIVGGVLTTPVVNGGAITGATMQLNANGITAKFDNSLVGGLYYAGVQVSNNSAPNLKSFLSAGLVSNVAADGAGTAVMHTLNGYGYAGFSTGSTFTIELYANTGVVKATSFQAGGYGGYSGTLPAGARPVVVGGIVTGYV